MARIKVPYLVKKPGARGKPARWYWQPGKTLTQHGWLSERLMHRDGTPISSEDDAIIAARMKNAEVAAWRLGTIEPNTKRIEVDRSLAALVQAYRQHRRYLEKAEKTRLDYDRYLRLIVEWAGDAPTAAITRSMVQELYETVRQKTPAAANALIRVLRIVLQLGQDMDWRIDNPAQKPGLVGIEPRLRVWSHAEEKTFVHQADAMGWHSIADALTTAIYTGQRQGDILKLRLDQLTTNGEGQPSRLTVRQGKTRAIVDIPIHPTLQTRLTAATARRSHQPNQALTVLSHDRTGRPWQGDTFRKVFASIRTEAVKSLPSLATAQFLDCRDTTVTRLAEAGSTTAEIASITGHKQGSVHQVLEHYLATTSDMATSAITKLLQHEAKNREAG